ncbi:MAG: phosphoglucosamine mutase, partial [Myxococcota bacterium]|nr:phosphoglucosamine mutase [Myxococcota bacterium]
MKPLRFGTDGIRGPSGTWPIDSRGARCVGRAVSHWTGGGEVLVGRDTRASGVELEQAVTEGLIAGGSDVGLLGVLPTAAVSCAVEAHGAAAGIMITASHNQAEDNGLKVLGAGGGKLADTRDLESALDGAVRDVLVFAGSLGSERSLADPVAPWRSALPRADLSGWSLLVDCAHGATAPFAADLFRDLGARVVERGARPDGTNINLGCGAMDPPRDLEGCDLAIAFDGDGDRVALVIPGPRILDGDDLLWLLSREGEGPVVGTIMTNGGLEESLAGRLIRTPVGDRHVSEAMERTGALVGGEPSGHIMLQEGPPTACGVYTALRVLASGRPLPALDWQRWPQVLRSVPSHHALETLRTPELARQAGARVVVRYSGTEPVVRVMVEGTDASHWVD